MEKLHLSDKAIQNDIELGIPLIPVAEIYLDHEFNHRGRISPNECIELARDISGRGLQQPITLRRLRTEDMGKGLDAEPGPIKKGFTYKVIAGHRRLLAYRILEAEKIPAVVKKGQMSYFDEKDLNAIENLQRQELNILQECNAIRHYYEARWTRNEIAERIGKTISWVQTRMALLSMPESVQELAGQGYLTLQHITELYKHKKPEEQIKLAVMIRDRKKRGDKNPLRGIRKKDKASSQKHRSRNQIFETLEEVQDVLKKAQNDKIVAIGDLVTEQGNCFATKCLAWAAGEITSLVFYLALKDFAKECGIEYEMPEFDGGVELDKWR